MRLADIIELQEVKLVIDLDDVESDPEGIVNCFVLTEEIERGLRAILKDIEAQKGCGVFIKGNFGSGKSHFLSFLYLLLRDKRHPILTDFKGIGALYLNLIKLSLVRYPSSLGLESILLQHLDYRERVSDREEVFKGLFNRPTVLIIDELSEFLRSKPSPPQFYEDVRFLQFLGEFSMRHPLWIVASLQEWIEETGHTSSSLFNRIKDRYALKINLTTSHIEDIIDQRLVIKKEGSEEALKRVFNDLKRFYPNLALSLDKFRKTYPLHPITTRFLSGLTRIFSQHRGVIQFVRLEVGKRLNEPFDSLITPETIFDHFEDRLREMPEVSNLVRMVYDYYRNNLTSIFNNPMQIKVAEAVIKILILTELSHLERRKTAKDIAEILLKKISTLKDSINYDYITNILEQLTIHQMYIMKEADTYFIDISQEEGIRVKAKIKALRERFTDKDYLFSEVANLISLPYLPLRELKDGRRYRFNWQNSMRECMVLLSNEVSNDELDRFIQGLSNRFDGYLLILSPWSRLSIQPSVLHLQPLSLIFLWRPRALTEEELLFVEEYIAKTLLLNEFPSLKEGLRQAEPLLRDIITKAYFEGEVSSAAAKDTFNIKEMGYLPIERLLSHLFDYPLRSLYPEHQKIMPRVDIYSSQHINQLFSIFIRQGRLTIEEAEKRALVPYIKGILEPLGLAVKKGGSFTLRIAPEDELIAYVTNLTNKGHDLYSIRTNLKRSPWGLSDSQIDLILSSLIVSGYLIPSSRHETVDFKDLSQLSSGDIITLRPGKAIDPELLSAIPKGRFIWGDVEIPPTPSTLKTMWREATALIRRYRKVIDDLRSEVNRYSDYSIFKLIHINMPLLNRLGLFLHSVGLNLSAQEGIERFLLFLKDNDMEADIAYVERLQRFFSEAFQLVNKYYLYLIHPSLPEIDPIKEMKDALLSRIQAFLKVFDDIEEVRVLWTGFFDAYSSLYKDSHDKFYGSPIFDIKSKVEELPVSRALKRVSHIVSSITFPKEWWEIKREIDSLPDRCAFDLNQEIFLNPICRCGYQIGQKSPVMDIDLPQRCEEGIRNFVRTLEQPEYKEKIDSTITGLNLSGKKDLSDRLLRLLSINPDKAPVEPILPLLEPEVLQEIENALRGRWKVKEVIIEDLMGHIKGRRFMYEELKRILLDWIGSDGDSIIHVKARQAEGVIGEELAIYGIEGKKVQLELTTSNNPKEERLLGLLDEINLRRFDVSELIGFLKRERQGYMKKRLRNELFDRFFNTEDLRELLIQQGLNKVSTDNLIGADLDIEQTTADLMKAIYLIKRAGHVTGVRLFTDVIAPLFILTERLIYGNINERLIDQGLLKRLSESCEALLRTYQKGDYRHDGLKDLYFVKERLSGPVVIIDGLRYDLWLLLKDTLIKEGWRIRDEVFCIDTPSTTHNFRQALGITEVQGSGALHDEGSKIDSKTYTLLKVAERDIGKRDLKRFLSGPEEIKVLHLNFIDTRIHASTIDLYPLYEVIRKEFTAGIIPLLKEVRAFYLLSDHGFNDTKEPKERYRHGGKSPWETILPFAEVRL